jgi:hypothetical protein
MPISIQDPAIPGTPFLHESLLEKCDGAISGGGAFAFVSKAGAELLFKDHVFTGFLSHSNFDLVVGVDSVTNIPALHTLTELRRVYPKLKVRVFCHNRANALFHPKFCWFRHPKKGFLITGSGNLTTGGLRGNWEAYTITKLDRTELRDVESRWSMWLSVHSELLKSTDDDIALERAALNIRRPRLVLPLKDITVSTETRIAVVDGFGEREVLLAEIPRAGDRWNQGNFTYENFQNFFGMGTEGLPEAERRILLMHVAPDGILETLESRPGVVVKSRNFRFELEAASGREYPETGRPIGVFVRTGARTFIYRLVMPDDRDYRTVTTFLKSEWEKTITRGRQDLIMRRVQTNVNALRQAWPSSPLWIAKTESED